MTRAMTGVAVNGLIGVGALRVMDKGGLTLGASGLEFESSFSESGIVRTR